MDYQYHGSELTGGTEDEMTAWLESDDPADREPTLLGIAFITKMAVESGLITAGEQRAIETLPPRQLVQRTRVLYDDWCDWFGLNIERTLAVGLPVFVPDVKQIMAMPHGITRDAEIQRFREDVRFWNSIRKLIQDVLNAL